MHFQDCPDQNTFLPSSLPHRSRCHGNMQNTLKLLSLVLQQVLQCTQLAEVFKNNRHDTVDILRLRRISTAQLTESFTRKEQVFLLIRNIICIITRMVVLFPRGLQVCGRCTVASFYPRSLRRLSGESLLNLSWVTLKHLIKRLLICRKSCSFLVVFNNYLHLTTNWISLHAEFNLTSSVRWPICKQFKGWAVHFFFNVF